MLLSGMALVDVAIMLEPSLLCTCMFVLSGETLSLNSCLAHVDSNNNYTHALTVVIPKLYFRAWV